jgi:N-acetylglucosamine-6-phosphate deacetylase
MTQITGLLPDGSRLATVSCSQGKVSQVQVGPPSPKNEAGQAILCPGFIDVQVNGWGGVAFNDPALTTEQVESVTRRLWQTGVTLYCPTLITDSFENLSRGLAAIARAKAESPVGVAILGIHLEGPYLSPEDGPRGAHPLAHVRPPDWDEFRRLQDAARGLICMVTLAPEIDGAIPFIEKLVASGVRVAIGHTAAAASDIRAAIAGGASMSTHLGNAAHDRLQRHHNYVYEQLAADELWTSLIVDGHHLPPSLVKIFVRAKRPERTILVSDAMHWAGMPAGVYPFGEIEVEVRDDGWIGVVGQPRLAGSGLLLYRGIENVVRFTGISLADAVRMVTENPAEMLGVFPRVGAIQTGSDAHFSMIEWQPDANKLVVQQTIVSGEIVFSA